MTLETEIENDICDEAIDAGWIPRKLTFIGVRGAPDRLFGKNGRTIVIEFKRPDDGRVSRQQSKRHRELREAFGWEVHVCDTRDDARRVLGLS